MSCRDDFCEYAEECDKIVVFLECLLMNHYESRSVAVIGGIDIVCSKRA